MTYEDITNVEMDEAIMDLAKDAGVKSIYSIPGVREIVAEYYNNDAINHVLDIRGASGINLEALEEHSMTVQLEYWKALAEARLNFGATGECSWCDCSGTIQMPPKLSTMFPLRGFQCPACW